MPHYLEHGAQKPAPAKAGDIDERVNAFLDRPIDGQWP
jgi:hypothetical protein